MNNSGFDVRLLPRDKIDIVKWDRCIENAENGLVYAKSFYLDHMAKHWSALIYGDYEIVMPLTWNRKYGIKYLYQPAFTGQLGIFFYSIPDHSVINSFFDIAKKNFPFCEIHLNFENEVANGIKRTNYILDLNPPYEQLRLKFKKKDLLKNLKVANSNQLIYGESPDYINTLTTFKKEYCSRLKGIKNSDFRRFENLCLTLSKNKMLLHRVVKETNGHLLSSGIFFQDSKRIYNIMAGTYGQERIKGSHAFLIEQLLREFAGQDLIFDFAGSEIPGVAAFNKKFGSTNQPYWSFRYNKLPYPIRLFKR